MSAESSHRMSIRGFKKSFKKSNQFFSEKIGLAKGTELNERYIKLEKNVDIIAKLVDETREKTHEFLQPNPVVRTKLTTVNNWARIRGDEKLTQYPQPEKILGESMLKYSDELGQSTNFGNALFDLGNSLTQMSSCKQLLENNVQQNYIEPLTYLKHNDLKTVMQSRKLSESLRLDYDSQRKMKKHSVNRDRELQMASERFEDSKTMTEAEMIKLVNNESDQVNLIQNFANALLDYHKNCEDILKNTIKDLNEKQKAIKDGKQDFLSAKTRNLKQEIADMVKQEERESAKL